MEYTTERGVTIEVVPIPLLLDKIRRAHPDIPLPTYTEHLAGGATQEVAITEKDAATWRTSDPESWQAHAEKWTAYETAARLRNRHVNDLLWRAILMRAISCQMPTDDKWADEQKSLGIDVPTDPTERRVHWLETEVIGGNHDIFRLSSLAGGLALDSEVLEAAEASFRGTLQRQTNRRV